jgi:hypothetical protein
VPRHTLNLKNTCLDHPVRKNNLLAFAIAISAPLDACKARAGRNYMRKFVAIFTN